MSNMFAIHRQQGGRALRDLLAKPIGNLLTVLVVAVSLSLPATLFVLTKNVVSVTEQWQSPNQLTVFLNKLPAARAKEWADSLEKLPQISRTEYVSPEDGLNQLRETQGFADALNLLEDNPLPAAVLITPASSRSGDAIALAARLNEYSEVNEVRLNNAWLQRLSAIESLLLTLTSVFSGLMLFAVVLIIGNTLRLQVLNHRQEIQLLKLVGATDSYILRPYLYTGAWLALGGALLAWVVTGVVSLLADGAVAELATLYDSGFRLSGLDFSEALLLFMMAGLLGIFGAWLSAGKHMREIEPV